MYKKLTFRIDKECLHVNKKKDIIPNYFIYKKKTTGKCDSFSRERTIQLTLKSPRCWNI